MTCSTCRFVITRFKIAVVALALLGSVVSMGGCAAVGFVAYALEDPNPPIQYEAEYTGLANQTVAVLVSADKGILYQYPMARLEIAEWLTKGIRANVPGAKALDAKQVVDFQNRNIYWDSKPYSQVAKHLKVSRLVLVELTEYRLHEPGNVNIWQGRFSGTVQVVEANSSRPDDAAYDTQVSVTYPPKSTVGVVNADQRTIRLGTLDLFTRNTVGKFYDHTTNRK